MMLKRHSWAVLSERRPKLYLGIGDVNVAQYARFLKKVSSYRAMILARIWAGCPMTRAHKRTIDKSVNDMCMCQMETQDIAHIVFRCPLLPSPPASVSLLSSLPPAFTSALILSKHLHRDVLEGWKAACMRAVTFLEHRATHVSDRADVQADQEDATRVQSSPTDSRGHIPMLDSTSTYTYCAKCHVARRIRDVQHLYTKRCAKEEAQVICEGDYAVINGHCVRAQMARWRRSALRPQMVCVFCASAWWASGPPPSPSCAVGFPS